MTPARWGVGLRPADGELAELARAQREEDLARMARGFGAEEPGTLLDRLEDQHYGALVADTAAAADPRDDRWPAAKRWRAKARKPRGAGRTGRRVIR